MAASNFSSNNPMLKNSVFTNASRSYYTDTMTRNGTIQKTLVLFVILVIGGAISWTSNLTILQSYAGWFVLLIIGMGLSFATAFMPRVSPFTSPFYALVEGLLIGAISAAYNTFYNGIVTQAVTVTIGIFLVTLFFYSARIIKVTNRFRTGVLIATFGVMLIYLFDILLSAFGMSVPFLNDSGLIGIIINLVIIIIAALNFMLDFDYIDRACAMGAPKFMEWYLGFSIMVTFIWLYLEVLRLLSIIRGSSK